MNSRTKNQVKKALDKFGQATILFLGRSALVVAEDYEATAKAFAMSLAGGSPVMEVRDPNGVEFTIAAARITSVRDTQDIKDALAEVEAADEALNEAADATEDALAKVSEDVQAGTL